jgi:hypothetical protein
MSAGGTLKTLLEGKSLAAAFEKLLSDSVAQIPAGPGVGNAEVFEAVRRIQGSDRPDGPSFSVPPVALRYVLEHLHQGRHSDARPWYESGEGLRVYTRARDVVVERAIEVGLEKLAAARQVERQAQVRPRTHRYTVKCRFCKAKWMEDFSHEAVQHGKVYAGTRHHCPKTDESRAKFAESLRYRGIPERDFAERLGAEMSAYAIFVTRPVKWKQVAAPTKCSARCRGATGPNCDCQCRGKNHGGNQVL